MDIKEWFKRVEVDSEAFDLAGVTYQDMDEALSNISVPFHIEDRYAYLSCPITGMKSLKVTKWQKDLEYRLGMRGITLLDPKAFMPSDFFTPDIALDNRYLVCLDLLLIEHAQMVFLDVTAKHSFGASIECMFAHKVGKPATVIYSNLSYSTVDSRWARHFTGVWIPDVNIARAL